MVPVVTLFDTVNGSLWHRKHLKGWFSLLKHLKGALQRWADQFFQDQKCILISFPELCFAVSIPNMIVTSPIELALVVQSTGSKKAGKIHSGILLLFCNWCYGISLMEDLWDHLDVRETVIWTWNHPSQTMAEPFMCAWQWVLDKSPAGLCKPTIWAMQFSLGTPVPSC